MPTHIRAMCYWQVGTMLPRDRMMINPCFRHQDEWIEGAPDWQTLADDVAAAIKGWEVSPTAHELTVKLYKIQDPVAGEPNRPKATKILNVGMSAESAVFREQAICLSFYGGQNFPRQRGRLYIPAVKCTSNDFNVRPNATSRGKVEALGPLLAALGGVNMDWIVWSPTNKTATKVEKLFVDDEWDVQRRRGLKPTLRTLISTGG
jgi:hypothetical protein